MSNLRGWPTGPIRRALAWRLVLVAVAYIAAGQVSLLLRHPLGGISPLWLPSAVALVAVMQLGPIAVLGVVVGGLVGSKLGGFSHASAATGAIAATAEVMLAHALLRSRRVTLVHLLDGVRPMWRFVLAVLPAAVVGAALGVVGLVVTGDMSDAVPQGFGLWFAGDLVGMLLVVPVVAALMRGQVLVMRGRTDWIPIVLALGLTLAIFFYTDPSREGHHVFGYLVFPFVVWTALVANVSASTLTHAAVGVLAIVGTALGLGPYAVTASPTDVGLLQVFVVAVIATSLFLKAAMQDRRRAFDHLRYQATRDALTGLLSRRGMREALDRKLALARSDGREMSVAFVDIDNFGVVNDATGHGGGDQVLCELSVRLRGVVGPGDALARPGGDEFVVVADGGRDEASALATRLIEAVREPVLASGRTFRLTCSVGVARCPADGNDAESLLRFADIAMYEAKAMGKNAQAHFTPEIHARRMARIELETALRGAMARGDFSLHYQPQVDMATGRIVGAEALLRWRDDSLGNVSPSAFIPVAEGIGLVDEVGQWVIEQACEQLRRWLDAGFRPPRLAVNLSPMQLRPDLVPRWRHAMDEAGLPPDLLEAELTETCVMRDERTSLSVVQDLARQGVRVSLDDFGTGQSSLSMLTKLPLDTVKIDQSFVQQVGRSDAAQVVSAVVTLAHRLGLRCLAEGVETQAQEAFLRDVGCDAYQGYLFCRPLSADEFEQRFLSRTAGARLH